MIDAYEYMYKYFENAVKPDALFKNEIIKQNVPKQRFVLVREYFVSITSQFYPMPNVARYQLLFNDSSEVKARTLAYSVANKLSEKYNIYIDLNGVETVNSGLRIAAFRIMGQPISIGMVSGGGYQYSQNYEIQY